MSVVIDEAVTEALETDNLALQNMSGSKYVQARLPHSCTCPCYSQHQLPRGLAPLHRIDHARPSCQGGISLKGPCFAWAFDNQRISCPAL